MGTFRHQYGMTNSPVCSLALALPLVCLAAAPRVTKDPAPTAANVPYGSHERQVLDLWRAKSNKPTPVAFHIHGGGWSSGDKSNALRTLQIQRLLDAGISVVSINYRLIKHGEEAGLKSPVQFPLEDARRALQFVRSKAGEWNLDKQRIGACGGSAGACSSLWLALHDDMADPNSPDTVARESTRLYCAAVLGAQTSLDPEQVRSWITNAVYGGHAFGFRKQGQARAQEFVKFIAAREDVLSEIRKYSPIEHLTADDPPLWLSYSQTNVAVRGEPEKDPTHSPLYGVMLEEKAKPLSLDVIVTYPARPKGDYKTITDYFLARLNP